MGNTKSKSWWMEAPPPQMQLELLLGMRSLQMSWPYRDCHCALPIKFGGCATGSISSNSVQCTVKHVIAVRSETVVTVHDDFIDFFVVAASVDPGNGPQRICGLVGTWA